MRHSIYLYPSLYGHTQPPVVSSASYAQGYYTDLAPSRVFLTAPAPPSSDARRAG